MGRPQHNQQRLFELLCLETYQAGLSWQTVLNKRAAFNEDFADYDVDQVAAMTTADVERLLTDARIIRHRQKLMATINNARVIRDWPAGKILPLGYGRLLITSLYARRGRQSMRFRQQTTWRNKCLKRWNAAASSLSGRQPFILIFKRLVSLMIMWRTAHLLQKIYRPNALNSWRGE